MIRAGLQTPPQPLRRPAEADSQQVTHRPGCRMNTAPAHPHRLPPRPVQLLLARRRQPRPLQQLQRRHRYYYVSSPKPRTRRVTAKTPKCGLGRFGACPALLRHSIFMSKRRPQGHPGTERKCRPGCTGIGTGHRRRPTPVAAHRSPRSGAAPAATPTTGLPPIGGYFTPSRDFGRIRNVTWAMASLVYGSPIPRGWPRSAGGE